MATLPPPEPILERLDDFFSAGANTELVRTFVEANGDRIARVSGTDSREALEAYDLFKRYGAIIDGILQGFLVQEAQAGRAVAAADVVGAVQREWALPGGDMRLLCTSHINAALSFDDFLELVAQWDDIANFMDEMEDDEDGGEAAGEEQV